MLTRAFDDLSPLAQTTKLCLRASPMMALLLCACTGSPCERGHPTLAFGVADAAGTIDLSLTEIPLQSRDEENGVSVGWMATGYNFDDYTGRFIVQRFDDQYERFKILSFDESVAPECIESGDPPFHQRIAWLPVNATAGDLLAIDVRLFSDHLPSRLNPAIVVEVVE